MQSSSYWRIRESNHLPTGSAPIAAVPRVSVKTLHGVAQDHFEELPRGNGLPNLARRFSFLQCGQQLELLFTRQRRVDLAELCQCHLVHAANSFAIGRPQMAIGPAQLQVDKIDDASPVRAGICIGRDKLIANRSQRAGFIDAQKAPGTSDAGAGDGPTGRRSGSGELDKLAAAEISIPTHGKSSLTPTARLTLGLQPFPPEQRSVPVVVRPHKGRRHRCRVGPSPRKPFKQNSLAPLVRLGRPAVGN